MVRESRSTARAPVAGPGPVLRPAHHRVDAGDELSLIERLRQIVIGADTKALDLLFRVREGRENEHRRLDAGRAQPRQYLIAIHIGEQEIE